MASIFQRGKQGIWWIKYYVNGRQVYHSLRTTSVRVAKQVKRQVEGDKAKGELLGPSKTSLPEFLEDYCRFLSTERTAKSYANDLSVLRIAFGPITAALEPGSCVNKRFGSAGKGKLGRRVKATCIQAAHLEDVTAAKIEDFISRRIRDDGISPKTANRCRAVLRSMFAYATKKWKFVSADHRYPNPAGAVQRRKEPARTIRFLTLEDIDKQRAVLEVHPTLHAMVATLIYAGLRRSELLWLTRDDVDLDRRVLRIRAKTVGGEFWQPKTGQNRVVPISTPLLKILAAYTSNGEGPWFFSSPTGKRWDPDVFSQTLRKTNTKHDLDWSCLDFRHTFGSQLAQLERSLYHISEFMGNSPRICRKHYAALVPEAMHDVVEFTKMPEAPAGARSLRAVLKQMLAVVEDDAPITRNSSGTPIRNANCAGGSHSSPSSRPEGLSCGLSIP